LNTADLIPELARDAKEISKYWNALSDPDGIDERTELIPEHVLPELRREIEESLQPASRQEIAKAVAVVIGGCKIPTNAIEDKEAYFGSMRSRLSTAGYPADTINEAVIEALDTEQWTPSIATLLESAKNFVEDRHRRLRAISRMAAEHRRRRRVAVERETEAAQEAKREAERVAYQQAELKRLRDLEVRARELFGDIAPLPGDIELANSLSPMRLYCAGMRVSWRAGLGGGEQWAVEYCRKMALAARLKRAHEQGRVSWDDALALTKLIVADEASARHKTDQIESRAPGYRDGKLPESFWRAVWKIAGACGLDAPIFPEDAAAVAIRNLKHLTGLSELADTRAVLDKQAKEAWDERRRQRTMELPQRSQQTTESIRASPSAEQRAEQ
jgi:hypothetical protein